MFLWGPKDANDNQKIFNAVKYQIFSGFGQLNDKETQESIKNLTNA